MNMTRSANEALREICPDKRTLFFSRSSYVGAHRYGGIWQGDNKSWWSHILQSMQQLPALNMAGFLFTGSDTGGFGCDTTEDLMLRWLQYSLFTPLFRNHSADGTREQELYRFSNADAAGNMIRIRYSLVPYLYSEFLKAALQDEKIGTWLKGARAYYLQAYKDSDEVLQPGFSSYSLEELEHFRSILLKTISRVEIRGID